MELKNLFDLSGRTALVTGGGRGIGAFISTGLAEAGADVIVASRKIETCRAQAAKLAAFGVRAIGIGADLGDEESIGQLVDQSYAEFGRVDILVNNSGITWGAPTFEYPAKAWDKVFNVNVRGLWLLTQAVGARMKEGGGGSIINIASIMGLRGADEISQPAVAYNAAKGAVINLTRDLAVKWAEHNIRVNAIAPGFFATDMMAFIESPEYAALKETMFDKIPQRRVGGEDDMKGAAVFLASDAAAYITGETLVIDGGYTAK